MQRSAGILILLLAQPLRAGDDLPTQKVRKPIRLISASDIKAAGNYREIPLATAQEAALSERVSDVLQKQTGVQVNRAGAPGTQSIMGVRGSSPDQVEYFIEDMPLPKPYYGPLNLETLPLPLFRSVEIFPSFIPSHLPAANIGGAVNFRLKELTGGETSYLTQATGSSLLGNGLAVARLTDSTLHFMNVEQSRNRYSYLNNNGTTENTSDDAMRQRQNEDFSRLGYTAFARQKLSDWKISALVDLNHTERGLPGTQNLPLMAVRQTADRVAGSVSGQRPIGENFRLQLFTSGAFDRQEINDSERELMAATRSRSWSPQILGGATLGFRTEALDMALSTRGKYQTITIDDNRIAERREGQGALSAAFDKKLFRLAAQTSATLGEDRAGQSAFYASQSQVFAQQGVSASGLAALRPLHFFRSESSTATDSILELYAQASSGYRTPTLYERFGDNIFVTPSETLRSERAVTNAGGMKSAFPCPLGFTCSLRSEVWLTGAKDYIIFTQNSARTLIAVNASSAQIWGLENEAMLSLPERFLLSLRYTYLDARDYGNIPYYQDKFLPLRPRHHAVAAATFFYKSLRFISTVEYRGAIFRDRYNSYAFYLPSKVLVDAGVDWILQGKARHTLNFTVKNITDNTDVDLIGYTVPGRYVLVRWTAEF